MSTNTPHAMHLCNDCTSTCSLPNYLVIYIVNEYACSNKNFKVPFEPVVKRLRSQCCVGGHSFLSDSKKFRSLEYVLNKKVVKLLICVGTVFKHTHWSPLVLLRAGLEPSISCTRDGRANQEAIYIHRHRYIYTQIYISFFDGCVAWHYS